MKRSWPWLAIGWFWAVPLAAQGLRTESTGPTTAHIMGVCRMQGQPVEGVRVQIIDQSNVAVTDARGHFFLGPVPVGRYLIETRRMGFRPVRRMVDLTAPRDTMIELELVAVPITVDEMVVEAIAEEGHRTHDLAEPLRVPPVGTGNVTTVTSRQIREVHAHDSWDLARQTTGLEIHEQGQGPGMASNAVIRGFSSDHSADLAAVVDGVPLNEPINGHVEGIADWNLILPAAIADMQVVKGPISLLFGNFAAGGAVNITTRASARRPTLDVEAGSYGQVGGTYTNGFESGPWGAFLAVRGERLGGWRDNSGYRTGHFLARVNRRLSDRVLADGGVQLYSTRWSSPGYLSLSDFESGRFTTAADPTDGGDKWRATARLAALVKTEQLSWQTTLWGYWNRWQLFLSLPATGSEMGGRGAQTEDREVRDAFGGRSVARWTRGAREFTLGVEGQRQQPDYGRYATDGRLRNLTLRRYEATYVNGTGFAGVASTFGRLLRLEAGLRGDVLQTHSADRLAIVQPATTAHKVLSPKAGAVIYVRSDWHLYASAARGFRTAPEFIREPMLHPVSIWSYEVGTRYARAMVDASISAFRVESDYERLYNPVTLRIESDGRSVREGIEFQVAFRPTAMLSFHGHWTVNSKGTLFLPETPGAAADTTMSGHQHAPGIPSLRQDGGMAGDSGTVQHHPIATLAGSVPGVADYMGQAGIMLRPIHFIEANAWITLTGPYVPLGEPGIEVPRHTLSNLQFRIFLGPSTEVALGVDNIFNIRGPEFRASGFLTPCQARTLHLGVTRQV